MIISLLALTILACLAFHATLILSVVEGEKFSFETIYASPNYFPFSVSAHFFKFNPLVDEIIEKNS